MLRADPTRRTLRRTTGDTWFDHAVLGAALALLLTGFSSVIQGSDWWISAALVAVLTGLTCGMLRSIGARAVTPIAVGVELLALVWIFVPTTLLGVLPTAGTLRALVDLLADAQTIIIEEQAPVAAAKPVVLVIASSFGLLVIVADALLERRRAAHTIGLLLLAVFATPALISGTTPSVWLFVAVAALWLVLLRTRIRDRTSGGWQTRIPALAVAGSALAVSVLLPPALPDVTAVATAWGKPPPTVFGRGINPILELGQNLRRNSPVVSLTYTTTLATPPYLKVATLRNFTGKTWKPSGTTTLDLFEGEFGLDPKIDRSENTTRIEITNLRSSLLPVPYVTRDISGLKGNWRFEKMGATIRSEEANTSGQTYSAKSLTVEPTAEEMRSLDTVIRPTLQPFVTLPANMPEVIGRTARQVTSQATNDYDKALALQSFLRDGDFAYSESAPVADGYDGNGVDVIAEFLRSKAGYCVHFSSTMAVMARAEGIPSRIAVGYAPGTAVGQRDGSNVYENTSDDLHAWPELYFEGAGWVRFEPTPSIGSATAFVEPNGSAPTPSDSGSDPASPQNSRDGANRPDSTTPTATPSTQTAPRTALVTFAGLLLVASTPGLLRGARRRWRLRQGVGSADPLWRELEDTARDFGIPTSPADTPRGFAQRLRGREGIDIAALDGLLQRVESTRFARASTQEGDGVQDLQAITASLRAGASNREKLRASALPRSLSGRRAYVLAATPLAAG